MQKSQLLTSLALLAVSLPALAQAPAKDVNVVNVPEVTVTNDEQRPVAVSIVDDYVNLRITGEFPENGCCLTDPTTGFVPQLDTTGLGGRNLLLEYVSCQVLLTFPQPVNLYLGAGGQDAPVDSVLAMQLVEQFRALSDDSLFGSAFHATHTVHLLVDTGIPLFLNGRRQVGAEGGGRASCILSGRLLD